MTDKIKKKKKVVHDLYPEIDGQPVYHVIRVHPGVDRFDTTSVANSCDYVAKRGPKKKTLQWTGLK